MDLLDFAASDDPVWAPLLNPKNGAPLTNGGSPGKPGPLIEWGLYGPDSAVLSAYDRKARQKTLNSLTPAKLRSTSGLNMDVDEIDGQTLDRLVTATAGWRHLSIGGEVQQFSSARAREILADPRFRWIGRQLENRLADEGNFLGTAVPVQKK